MYRNCFVKAGMRVFCSRCGKILLQDRYNYLKHLEKCDCAENNMSLKDEFSIGVMEADMDSDVDAQTISELGVRVIQLHTGGSCHMDADMTKRGLDRMSVEGLDVVILENVGNLVCPAEFDVGAALKVMILSAPEGDDKPLKYPLMFTVSDVMLENKIDTKDVFDYDPEKAEERARALNPDIHTFRVSAKTGEGFDEWTSWLKEQIRTWRNER